MPFGLINVPTMFQRPMDKLLNGWNFVFIYLDDILIAFRNFKEHSSYVTEVRTSEITRCWIQSETLQILICWETSRLSWAQCSAAGVCPTHKNVLAVKKSPAHTQ